jgi:hypothetical protein
MVSMIHCTCTVQCTTKIFIYFPLKYHEYFNSKLSYFNVIFNKTLIHTKQDFLVKMTEYFLSIIYLGNNSFCSVFPSFSYILI